MGRAWLAMGPVSAPTVDRVPSVGFDILPFPEIRSGRLALTRHEWR
jgi:hypothetical protein